MLELGDTSDILVCIIKVIITGMSKALVPKEALGSCFDGPNWCVLLDVFVEWEIMIVNGDTPEFSC